MLLCRALAPTHRGCLSRVPQELRVTRRMRAERRAVVPVRLLGGHRAGNTGGAWAPHAVAAGQNISGNSAVRRKSVQRSSAVGTKGPGSGPGAASCSQSPVVGPRAELTPRRTEPPIIGTETCSCLSLSFHRLAAPATSPREPGALRKCLCRC